MFLIIPILKKTNDYNLDIENQGGLIFDKISNDFYDNINFYIDDELYSSNLLRGFFGIIEFFLGLINPWLLAIIIITILIGLISSGNK